MINVIIPAESITNCDTKKFFNRANLSYLFIFLLHILISRSQFARVCCLCLYEMYISLVLESYNDMLFELHKDKTLCKSVV